MGYSSTTVVSTCLSSREQRQGAPLFGGIILGEPLMPPTPAGPGENLDHGLRHGQDETPEPSPNLGHTQRDVRPRGSLQDARPLRFWTGGGRFLTIPTALGPARRTTKRA